MGHGKAQLSLTALSLVDHNDRQLHHGMDELNACHCIKDSARYLQAVKRTSKKNPPVHFLRHTVAVA